LRNRYAHHHAVRGGIEAEAGLADRLLDGGDHGFVPDLNRQHPRFRRADRAHLIQRHFLPVGDHFDRFQQAGMRAAGAKAGELAAQRFHRTVHTSGEVFFQCLQVGGHLDASQLAAGGPDGTFVNRTCVSRYSLRRSV
jgi:hypothetical protein